jgi:hypothetical protein
MHAEQITNRLDMDKRAASQRRQAEHAQPCVYPTSNQGTAAATRTKRCFVCLSGVLQQIIDGVDDRISRTRLHAVCDVTGLSVAQTPSGAR